MPSASPSRSRRTCSSRSCWPCASTSSTTTSCSRSPARCASRSTGTTSDCGPRSRHSRRRSSRSWTSSASRPERGTDWHRIGAPPSRFRALRAGTVANPLPPRGAREHRDGLRAAGLRHLQRLDLAVDGQLLERARLDLPHTLARQAELAADRLERSRIAVAVQPVAPLQHFLLLVGKLGDRAPEHVLLEADRQLLLGLRLLGGEQVAERGIALRADRPVEARDRARGLPHFSELLQRELRLLGDLLVGRLPPELRGERPLRASDFLLAVGDVHRDPDGPRLVGHPALNGLADPPGRVRRELEAAAPVELLHRADQADDSLLDQVEQREPVALIPLRDRDDQAQVRVDHPLLGFGVAALDPLGELDLFLLGQQRPATGLVEEELERVGGRDGEVAVHVGALVLLAAAVVADLDPALLELLVQPADLFVVEFLACDELVELREVDAVVLLALGEERLEQSRVFAHTDALPAWGRVENELR